MRCTPHAHTTQNNTTTQQTRQPIKSTQSTHPSNQPVSQSTNPTNITHTNNNTKTNKKTLNEYIEDTEDLVNLKLDQHRNQLIGIDLVLTAFTTAMAVMTAVAGFFGMNLNSYIQEEPVYFQLVTVSTTLGSLAMFAAFIALMWWKGILVL